MSEWKFKKFDCSLYKHICGAKCCSCFPIDVDIWERNKDKAFREIAEIQPVTLHGKERVIVLTFDLLCTFLDKDLNCLIYEDRPTICRQFGDERHPFMHCPFQHTDGTPRRR